MNRRNLRLVKIILFLFLLNSFSLLLYFFSNSKTLHSIDTRNKNDNNPDQNISLTLTSHGQNKPFNLFRYSKPWPILPSYLPWSQTPSPPALRSCEAYFGNGFTCRVDLVGPLGPGSGWFRCWFSGTLRSSVCEGGAIRMVPEKVRMSRGGERLEEVLGRSAEEELPEFEDGAFESNGGDEERERKEKKRKLVSGEVLDEIVPRGEVWKQTMRGLIGSAWVVPDREFECQEWIEEPTRLVTRFECANLFHTVMDWYSAYVASESLACLIGLIWCS